jgi:hypothetical protein
VRRTSGDGALAAARRLSENKLALAAGLVAALPVVLSTVRAIDTGWTPVGDDAVIAIRSYDVFTTHTPLLGQYSAASAVLEQGSHSLGPMLYWLLAIPARLGPLALAVTMGLANVACVLGAVVLARRRAGPAFMLVVAAAIAVMCGSLVGHLFSDVWNPAAGLLPLTLLVFLTWSVACGEYRLLPLTVVVASFVAQCHLAYLAPTVGLLAVGGTGVVMWRREAGAPQRAALRRAALVALVLGLLCWSAPILEQAVHRPGNLALLAKAAAAGDPRVGASGGAHAVARAVGVPPWWLTTPHSQSERYLDVGAPVGVLRAATAVLVLAGLVVVLGVGLRRRRTEVAAAAAQALVLAAALGMVAAGTPSGILSLSLGYTMWWGSIAGMWAWLVLAWGAATLVAEGRVRRRMEARRSLAALAIAGAAAVAVQLLSAGAGEDVLKPRYRPMRTLAARLERAIPEGRTVLVDSESGNGGFDSQFDFQMGSVYGLRSGGRRVVTHSSTALGKYYRPDRHTVDDYVRIERSQTAPAQPGIVLAKIPSGRGSHDFVWVTLVPHG